MATCPTCDSGRRLRVAAPDARPQVRSPEDAAALLLPRLRGRDREHCLLLALDTKHRLLATATVSIGSVDHTFMGPREVYREALLAAAAAIVLAHSHPSGDPTPSRDDRLVTARLAQAGATLGVPLLDHLVVGDPEWVSLARLGALDAAAAGGSLAVAASGYFSTGTSTSDPYSVHEPS